MPGQKTREGYSDQYTLDCERVLATLLSGLGPWRDSIVLIGGLTPRYLVKSKPPVVPPHVGTGDVDIVIDLEVLANTEAYSTLEDNLTKLKFERATNSKGQKVSWRWQTKTEHGATMILELLMDSPEQRGGSAKSLPTDGRISALNIPHASIVFDLCETTELKAELLDSKGVTTQTVRHANLVGFTCLKILAFRDRAEGKDLHDLVYCIEYGEGGIEAAAAQFKAELEGKHGEIIKTAIGALHKVFANEEGLEGYRKDGPVAIARFELGEGDDTGLRDARIRRQRDVAAIITRLLAAIG